MVEPDSEDRNEGLEVTDDQLEITIGVIGSASSVNIQFADGVFVVPAHVVAELGGPEAVLEKAEIWADSTYGDFMNGFHTILAERQINEYQRQFVANHFDPFGF